MQSLFLACATANAVVLAKSLDLPLAGEHPALTPESLRFSVLIATFGMRFAGYSLTLEKYSLA